MIAREHGPTVLVASVAACFGAVVPIAVDHMATAVQASELNATGTAGVMAQLGVLSLVVVSVVVASLVTGTTLQHVIEHRRRTIALRRLLGASARAERRVLVRETVLAAAVGACIGLGMGVLLGLAGTAVAVGQGVLPAGLDYSPLPPLAAVPAIVLVLAALAVAWRASRAVLSVSPIEALGVAQEPARHTGLPLGSVVMLGLGTLVLAGAVILGATTPLAVLVGILGGVLSYGGIVGLVPRILPPLLGRLATMRALPPVARIALRASADAPGRTGGIVLALATGIAAVVMFVVAGAGFAGALTTMETDPVRYALIVEMVDRIVLVIAALVGFSAVIAIIGFVTSLLTAVRRRSREIGLLRAVGMRAASVRRMLGVETAVVAGIAACLGLALGALYGWVGAYAFVGSVRGIGPVLPAVPPLAVAGVALAAAVIALVAAVPAGRRATRIAPLDALVAD